MQVDRSAWERDVIIAVTTRLRDSTALLDSQGIGVERLSWEGCDPDTALEVVILRRGRRHRRRWRVWKDMSGMFQPVPHPDVVAGQILADVLTMALPRGRDTSSEPDVPASATALPLVGRYGHEGRNGSPTT